MRQRTLTLISVILCSLCASLNADINADGSCSLVRHQARSLEKGRDISLTDQLFSILLNNITSHIMNAEQL